jgi:predicted small secreted protein
MKKTLLIAMTAALGLLASSCNTFIGLGRDIRLMGEGVEKSAVKSAGTNGNTTGTGNGHSAAPVY